MQSSGLRHTNLCKASAAGRQECVLDDSFFSALDQTEITGGSVRVALEVHRVTEALYKVKVNAAGEVRVFCDRCLEPLRLEVEVSETFSARDTKAVDEYGGTEDCVEGDAFDFDLAWPLYELVATALPLQRVHSAGQCNPDMVGRISTGDEAEEEVGE